MYRTCILELAFVALFALSAVAAPPATLDTDPNLCAWWTFDETSGKIAADASKHKRDGTLEGDLSFDKVSVPGKAGQAIRLDGEDAVVVKAYKGVTGTGPRTVAAWTKTTR